MTGIEPARRGTPDPKSGASASSATSAFYKAGIIITFTAAKVNQGNAVKMPEHLFSFPASFHILLKKLWDFCSNLFSSICLPSSPNLV
jgi:hypothetical protein